MRAPVASLFVGLCLLLCLGAFAQAHRVNVFAFVDGDGIQVECSFSRSNKVRNGQLYIRDAVTGETLLEGLTDEAGGFRFRPPEDFLLTGHALLITLHAGEGHQNEWRIDPDELRALSPLVVAPPSGEVARMQEAVNRAAPSPAPPAPAQPEALPVARSVAPQAAGHLNPPQAAGALNPSQAPLDTAELEAMMGRVLDAKLAPIRRALAERDDGPNLRDILGGIGWIFGLLGVAALMKFRKP